MVGAVALCRWPRRRSPLQLAAFTGALLVGFEIVLTHWSYLYLPWFFPFVAFAVLAPRTAEALVSDTASVLPTALQSSTVSDTAVDVALGDTSRSVSDTVEGSVSPTGSDAVSDT